MQGMVPAGSSGSGVADVERWSTGTSAGLSSGTGFEKGLL